MEIDVSKKVIVITGTSKGIGASLATEFAKEGAYVIGSYFNSKERAEKVFSTIKKYNNHCDFYKLDIRKASEIKRFHYNIVKKYKSIDVLINNAGICNDDYCSEMSLTKWNEVIDINLTGTFLCCREFLKSMNKHKNGKIFNIASLKGQTGSLKQCNYAASKAGVITLTTTLAKEQAKNNIMINAICPGFILTDMNKNNFEKAQNAQNSNLLNGNYALSDLINFLIYASSDKFNNISGRVFNLDSRLL